MDAQLRRGITAVAIGSAALAFVVASTTGCAVCAAPRPIVAPAMVRAEWTRSNAPALYLTPEAAQRGAAWCGAYLLTHQGQRPPCDPGRASSGERTRWDVQQDDARGMSADDPAIARYAAECDDAGGEWIANLSPRAIDAPATDPAWSVALGTCEDVDY